MWNLPNSLHIENFWERQLWIDLSHVLKIMGRVKNKIAMNGTECAFKTIYGRERILPQFFEKKRLPL